MSAFHIICVFVVGLIYTMGFVTLALIIWMAVQVLA